MIKRLCLLLAVLMLSGLTGCAKNNPELPQTNSSTEQSVNYSENNPAPPQTNSSVQQSTTSSESNHEPPIENTTAKPFGEIKIVPSSYNSSASRQGTVETFEYTSGDCWEYGNQGGRSHPRETAEYLGNFAASSKYGNDFFIYAMTGGDDIAYDAMNNQIGAMRETDAFMFGTSFDDGNIAFQVPDGATHDYTYYRNYIYTILPYFFEKIG